MEPPPAIMDQAQCGLYSKLLKGVYIGENIGSYFRGYSGGYSRSIVPVCIQESTVKG